MGCNCGKKKNRLAAARKAIKKSWNASDKRVKSHSNPQTNSNKQKHRLIGIEKIIILAKTNNEKTLLKI